MSVSQMVEYIQASAADEVDHVALLLNQLSNDIALKDWTIQDAVAEGLALAKVDEEYAMALDKFDSTGFRRRFPDLFS